MVELERFGYYNFLTHNMVYAGRVNEIEKLVEVGMEDGNKGFDKDALVFMRKKFLGDLDHFGGTVSCYGYKAWIVNEESLDNVGEGEFDLRSNNYETYFCKSNRQVIRRERNEEGEEIIVSHAIENDNVWMKWASTIFRDVEGDLFTG